MARLSGSRPLRTAAPVQKTRARKTATFGRPKSLFSLLSSLFSLLSLSLLLLCALSFQAGPGLQWRQFSLSWALFFISSYSTSCFSSSLSSYHFVSHEFLSLPFCLLRLYAEGIHFSTHDLTNFSVFVGWYSSFCFIHHVQNLLIRSIDKRHSNARSRTCFVNVHYIYKK